MPQLMPLMWMNSVLVIFLILFMLINLYNLNEDFGLMNFVENEYSKSMIKLLW